MRHFFLQRRNPWKGLVAGLAGGLVASWTMNQFQAAVAKLSRKQQQSDVELGRTGTEGPGVQSQSVPAQQVVENEDENATVLVAQALATRLFHHPLTEKGKKAAAPWVHYAYGTLAGGLYGALAEEWPVSKAGFGLPYGAALWLGGDEIAVPLLDLSKPPTKYPLKVHAMALAAHLVYGASVEAVRRLVRAVW